VNFSAGRCQQPTLATDEQAAPLWVSPVAPLKPVRYRNMGPWIVARFWTLQGLAVRPNNPAIATNYNVIHLLTGEFMVRIAFVDANSVAWILRVLPSPARLRWVFSRLLGRTTFSPITRNLLSSLLWRLTISPGLLTSLGYWVRFIGRLVVSGDPVPPVFGSSCQVVTNQKLCYWTPRLFTL
jgi:hypothetical protein